MFFLRLGSILAWLSVIVGAIRLATGIYVASIGDVAVRNAAAKRYLGSVEALTKGPDQGLMLLAFGVVLGILVKIGRSVSRNNNAAGRST